jgi:hypothetical protein
MEEILLILAGFMLGGWVVRLLMIGAARRHLRAHGTVNLSQVEQLLSIRGITAMRYLDQMERDGLLKLHAHAGKVAAGSFYTRG